MESDDKKREKADDLKTSPSDSNKPVGEIFPELLIPDEGIMDHVVPGTLPTFD
jgi:hypothetical protein